MTSDARKFGGGELMRSKPSRGLSFVRFCNATQRTVEVIWINYEGVRVKYKTLKPEEFFDVNTYVAHPWMFQDAVTHERLNANSRNVYEPGPWYEVRFLLTYSTIEKSMILYFPPCCFSTTFQTYAVAGFNHKIFNPNVSQLILQALSTL